MLCHDSPIDVHEFVLEFLFAAVKILSALEKGIEVDSSDLYKTILAIHSNVAPYNIRRILDTCPPNYIGIRDFLPSKKMTIKMEIKPGNSIVKYYPLGAKRPYEVKIYKAMFDLVTYSMIHLSWLAADKFHWIEK